MRATSLGGNGSNDMERLRAWAGSARDGTGPLVEGCGWAKMNTGRVEGATGGHG